MRGGHFAKSDSLAHDRRYDTGRLSHGNVRVHVASGRQNGVPPLVERLRLNDRVVRSIEVEGAGGTRKKQLRDIVVQTLDLGRTELPPGIEEAPRDFAVLP